MMDRDVFLSLLALDSYNRGYGQNIGNLSNTGCVGTAEVINDALVELDQDRVVSSGFSAIAYDWNGETIISYRGTNFLATPGIHDWLEYPSLRGA